MSWRSFKKAYFINRIAILALFILLVLACRSLHITCLFYELTSIPCPTCYMTRALFALAKGDIYTYMDYNIMALPVATVFLGELFKDLLGRYKHIFSIYAVMVLVLNFIYYLWRLN